MKKHNKLKNRQPTNLLPKKVTRQKEQQSLIESHPRLKKIKKYIFPFLSVCGYLFGVVSFYLALDHSIYIPETYSITSKNPLYTPFIFKNNNFLPLNDIKIEFVIIHLSGFGTYNYHWEVNNSTPMPYHINNITAYGEHTSEFDFQRLIGNEIIRAIESASIKVVTTYYVWIIPFQFVETKYFFAYKGDNNIIYWKPKQIE